jgi:hypothetical protein
VLDPLGSTSWHHRHLSSFRLLNRLLQDEPAGERTVMIIGPGGVTRLVAPLLNDAAVEETWAVRKLIGDAARYSDQLLRRIPGMPLRSLEPVELSRTLTVPHKLVVVDLSQRVLDAVAADVPDAICHCVDISFQPLPIRADVVIAFNIVCRLEDRAATGMIHVADAVLPGGWLQIDDRSADAHLAPLGQFVGVAPKTHRKQMPAGPDDDAFARNLQCPASEGP